MEVTGGNSWRKIWQYLQEKSSNTGRKKVALPVGKQYLNERGGNTWKKCVKRQYLEVRRGNT
jgi:hypothetical protein